jgi:hypothetical protein
VFSLGAKGPAGDYLFNLQATGTDPAKITHNAPIALYVVDFKFVRALTGFGECASWSEQCSRFVNGFGCRSIQRASYAFLLGIADGDGLSIPTVECGFTNQFEPDSSRCNHNDVDHQPAGNLSGHDQRSKPGRNDQDPTTDCER